MSAPQELWRYQRRGNDSTFSIRGASVALDNSVFLGGFAFGGSSKNDFTAAKLDSGGTLQWAWQNGTTEGDQLFAAVTVSDGGVVMAGYTNGNWSGFTSQGHVDFAAVKMDSTGSEVWRWQNGTAIHDYVRACVETADGNVVVAGHAAGSTKIAENVDIVAIKLDVNTGEEIWTFQVGAEDNSAVHAQAAAARADGSVVLAGYCYGTFANALSTTSGSTDFAAAAIDEDGDELWRWQDGPDSGNSILHACTALDDGSVIRAGSTEGDWDGTNKGGQDFAVVKLNESGFEEWRWQDGTDLDDMWEGAATTSDGTVIFAGFASGYWTGTQAVSSDNVRDFAAMAMDEEGQLLWTYQDGTDGEDEFNTVAVRPDGSILLAGRTYGTWNTSSDAGGSMQAAAVLLDGSVITTPSPAKSTPTPPPAESVDGGVITTPSPAKSTPTPPPAGSVDGGVISTPSPVNSTQKPSSHSVGLVAGCVAVGLASLVILGVVATRSSRQRRRTLRTGGTRERSFPAVSRHFPAAARPVEVAVPLDGF